MKFVSIIFTFLLTSCSALTPHFEKSDLYWSQLVTLSVEKKESILSILKDKNSHLYKQIQNDARDMSLTSFWGKSLNFDSGAKNKIIADQILSDLQAVFSIHNDNYIVHAGITHTYGYLFSVLETPYGYKRKRWIDSSLNYAFSLSEQSLSPETKNGGLLSNITYFSGMIAFKEQEQKNRLKNLLNVSLEIKNFDYSMLKVNHLEEVVSGDESTNVTLRTTLVLLPKKMKDSENDYLLIYSLYDQKKRHEVLITAFPIKADAYKKITDPRELGGNRPIVVRYNAYWPALMEKNLSGSRNIY